MKNVVTKLNVGLIPNNFPKLFGSPFNFAFDLYDIIFASIGHVIMCLRIAPCDRVIYVFFVFLFWVSIDSGVEGLSTYPDEQYFTPGAQIKKLETNER